MGLRAYFDVVAGPGLDAHAEAKTETLRAALARLGPTRAVMVGDRSFDVLAAHANGLPAIGVTWGIGSAQELQRTPSALIDRPAELPDAVAVLLGE